MVRRYQYVPYDAGKYGYLLLFATKYGYLLIYPNQYAYEIPWGGPQVPKLRGCLLRGTAVYLQSTCKLRQRKVAWHLQDGCAEWRVLVCDHLAHGVILGATFNAELLQ